MKCKGCGTTFGLHEGWCPVCLTKRVEELETKNTSLTESLEQCLSAIRPFDTTDYDGYGGPHLSQGITKLVAEVEQLQKRNAATITWLEREWKALSKSPGGFEGHRAASLTILEADLDVANDEAELEARLKKDWYSAWQRQVNKNSDLEAEIKKTRAVVDAARHIASLSHGYLEPSGCYSGHVVNWPCELRDALARLDAKEKSE